MSSQATANSYNLLGYAHGNYYIDVADLNLPSLYQVAFCPYISWIISGPPTGDVTFTMNEHLWLYYYDVNGNSLGNGYALQTLTFDTSASGTIKNTTGKYFTLPAECAYVRPVIQITGSVPAYCTVNLTMTGTYLMFDVNMIAENSDTLKQVNEKLDQINDSLNVSSGGAASDFVDKVGDQSDQLQDISGILDSVDRPDPDSVNVSIDEYVSPSDMQQVSGILSVLFQSDLFLMMLMVLLTMSVAAYALYGKRG